MASSQVLVTTPSRLRTFPDELSVSCDLRVITVGKTHLAGFVSSITWPWPPHMVSHNLLRYHQLAGTQHRFEAHIKHKVRKVVIFDIDLHHGIVAAELVR